jgi:hypothetical protein
MEWQQTFLANDGIGFSRIVQTRYRSFNRIEYVSKKESNREFSIDATSLLIGSFHPSLNKEALLLLFR